MTTPAPTSHAFDRAINLTAAGTNLFRGEVDDSFQNMVGPFGGVTAATLLNGALQHPERIGEPVSLTVNFAGPVQLGAFELEAIPLRTNRSTQHWLLLQKQGSILINYFSNNKRLPSSCSCEMKGEISQAKPTDSCSEEH